MVKSKAEKKIFVDFLQVQSAIEMTLIHWILFLLHFVIQLVFQTQYFGIGLFKMEAKQLDLTRLQKGYVDYGQF